MTQNVKLVVMDGKVIDTRFRKYKNPIPSFYAYQTLPMHLELSPLLITAGSGPTVLTVRGKGIWPHHRVYLDGQPLPTCYVSKDALKATIPAEAVASVGTYVVTVRSDGEPLAESHRAHLVVGFRE
jgi:hypothetical protein